MKRIFIALLSVAALAACSSPSNNSANSTDKKNEEASIASTSHPNSLMEMNELLSNYGYTGMSAKEIISELESTPIERKPTELVAEVTNDELRLSDSSGAHAELPIAEETYVAVAPYKNHPRECMNHSLTTDLGELSNTPLHVEVADDSDVIVLEKDVTTFESGFFGLWLRPDFSGTITVSSEKGQGVGLISTKPGAPTCIMDLKLLES